MAKSIDQKRTEAAARRLEDVKRHLGSAAHALASGLPDRVAHYTRKADIAERDAANALAKVRSRPATFVPWYERNDPILPGPQ